MFTIKLADVVIGIDNRYSFVERLCRGYVCESDDVAFAVSVTDAEIAKEQSLGDFPEGYCESICIYRKICERITAHGVFLMHASIIEADGYAYAFSAPSGTGKSTHAAFWRSVLGAQIINDDKPAVRRIKGEFCACGTPFSGKTAQSRAVCVPFGAVVFVTRGETVAVRRLSTDEALYALLSQTLRPTTASSYTQLLDLVSSFLDTVPVYEASVTLDPSCAQQVKEAIGL